MYHIVWEYEVRADQLAAFEALYGPLGAWTQLFRSADGYRGTELYRDTTRPTHSRDPQPLSTVDHRPCARAGLRADLQVDRRTASDAGHGEGTLLA
jgi:hypothetical protein